MVLIAQRNNEGQSSATPHYNATTIHTTLYAYTQWSALFQMPYTIWIDFILFQRVFHFRAKISSLFCEWFAMELYTIITNGFLSFIDTFFNFWNIVLKRNYFYTRDLEPSLTARLV